MEGVRERERSSINNHRLKYSTVRPTRPDLPLQASAACVDTGNAQWSQCLAVSYIQIFLCLLCLPGAGGRKSGLEVC